MENFALLFESFGPWAVVVLSLVWCARFITLQLDKAQAERQLLQERHSEEMSRLTDVIQNNTLAVQQLVNMLDERNKENG